MKNVILSVLILLLTFSCISSGSVVVTERASTIDINRDGDASGDEVIKKVVLAEDEKAEESATSGEQELPQAQSDRPAQSESVELAQEEPSDSEVTEQPVEVEAGHVDKKAEEREEPLVIAETETAEEWPVEGALAESEAEKLRDRQEELVLNAGPESESGADEDVGVSVDSEEWPVEGALEDEQAIERLVKKLEDLEQPDKRQPRKEKSAQVEKSEDRQTEPNFVEEVASKEAPLVEEKAPVKQKAEPVKLSKVKKIDPIKAEDKKDRETHEKKRAVKSKKENSEDLYKEYLAFQRGYDLEKDSRGERHFAKRDDKKVESPVVNKEGSPEPLESPSKVEESELFERNLADESKTFITELNEEGPYKEAELTLITEAVEDKNLDLKNIENMKIIEQKMVNISAEENKRLNLSLKGQGWTIKSIAPPVLKLLERRVLEDNTLFVFQTEAPEIVNVIFIRYDDGLNVVYRKPYRIKVVAPKIFKIKEEEAGRDAPKEEEAIIFVDEGEGEGVKESLGDEKEERVVKGEDEDFRLSLANNLFNQMKYKEAGSRYRELIEEGYSDPELMFKMGIIEKSDGNYEKSMEYFAKNMEDEENIYYIKALLEFLKILKMQEKYSIALDEIYNRGFALELVMADAEELYLLLADIYYNMKDFVEASKEYRRFIEQFPNSFNLDKALFYLAYSLENFEQNPDYKEAYRIYQLLNDGYPESRYYNLSRNRLFYLSRHYLRVN